MKLEHLVNQEVTFLIKKFIIPDDIDLINEQSQQVFRNCLINIV